MQAFNCCAAEGAFNSTKLLTLLNLPPFIMSTNCVLWRRNAHTHPLSLEDLLRLDVDTCGTCSKAIGREGGGQASCSCGCRKRSGAISTPIKRAVLCRSACSSGAWSMEEQGWWQ